MTLQFPPDIEGKLDRLASQQGRTAESLVLEAVEILAGKFADHDEWFLAKVDEGLKAADQGKLVGRAAVRALMESRYPG